MRHTPVVVAVSGVKNSGKTTFLTHLIPLLREKGLRVGVIKHDGHTFVPDIPGTDSFRMRESGAETVAVVSNDRWMLVRESPLLDIAIILEQMSEMDLVLLEGYKDSDWPKIEVVRNAVSQACICRPDTLLAVATNIADLPLSVPRIPLDGYIEAAEFIWHFYIRRNQEKDNL